MWHFWGQWLSKCIFMLPLGCHCKQKTVPLGNDVTFIWLNTKNWEPQKYPFMNSFSFIMSCKNMYSFKRKQSQGRVRNLNDFSRYLQILKKEYNKIQEHFRSSSLSSSKSLCTMKTSVQKHYPCQKKNPVLRQINILEKSHSAACTVKLSH